MITLFDTTLRDGQQRQGVHLTLEDKLRVIARLDALGVAYIEAGFLASNPVDAKLFELVAAGEVALSQARLVAFGMTRRKGLAANRDEQLAKLAACPVDTVTVVGKAWLRHVLDVLETTAAENLAMVASSVEFLVQSGKRVFFDAEHFFDSYLCEPDYALAVLLAAVRAGAAAIILCDTNGGMLPHQVYDIVKDVVAALGRELAARDDIPVAGAVATASKAAVAAAATTKPAVAAAATTKTAVAATTLPIELGIHAHNDSGCAVANSIAAVMAGATMVQGTINGYGERAGNADLVTLIANLQLKMGEELLSAKQLATLSATSQYVAEVFNIAPDAHQPYVGSSAFAHKGGLHASGTAKLRGAYEHVQPERVGNFAHLVISDLAGKASLQGKARELGIALPESENELSAILASVKAREAKGYSYEMADASLALLLSRHTGSDERLFVLESFRVTAEKRADGAVLTEATIKIHACGERHIATAEGNGPVNALDQALRQALCRFYPEIDSLRLSDYRVRVLDESVGTSAVTRVGIETTDGHRSWGTVGVSENIIEASWDALVDSLTYGLLK